MDRLSPLDASFLHMEDDVSHMHIASVGIFEGPAPDRRELLDIRAGRIDFAATHILPVLFADFAEAAGLPWSENGEAHAQFSQDFEGFDIDGCFRQP